MVNEGVAEDRREGARVEPPAGAGRRQRQAEELALGLGETAADRFGLAIGEQSLEVGDLRLRPADLVGELARREPA